MLGSIPVLRDPSHQYLPKYHDAWAPGLKSDPRERLSTRNVWGQGSVNTVENIYTILLGLTGPRVIITWGTWVSKTRLKTQCNLGLLHTISAPETLDLRFNVNRVTHYTRRSAETMESSIRKPSQTCECFCRFLRWEYCMCHTFWICMCGVLCVCMYFVSLYALCLCIVNLHMYVV